MEEIKNKIDLLLKQMLESLELKSQIKLLKNKEDILKSIDEIIKMYESLRDEK